jgi:ribose/xylose/arabinose/galactoside ABC-type transport system permease subunit
MKAARANGLLDGRNIWPLAALAAILLANLFLNPDFFQLDLNDGRLYGSLVDVLNRAAPLALLALGMSLVIATGGVDLSVGAVIAISGAVCANLINGGVENLILIIGAGLAAGLLAGLLNGVLVAYLGIQPIVATLVLMVAGRGVAQLINAGQIITFSHEGFAFLGVGSMLGLPTPVVLVLAVFASVAALVRLTALGLFIEAVGANAKAGHYCGIHISGVKIAVYAISGACAALAGMIVSADIQGADANNAGLWLELDAILAVVIGGAALSGGRFSLSQSLVGVLIIQALSTTILMAGTDPQYNLLIKALAIVAILLLQSGEFKRQVAAFVSRSAP